MFQQDGFDDGFRSGILDIEGYDIETPTNILTNTDLGALREFSYVNESYYKSLRKFGIHTKWVTEPLTNKLKRLHDDNYEDFRKTLERSFPKRPFKTKVINFEIPNYVEILNERVLLRLLKAQIELKCDIIQIPNFLKNKNYTRILDDSIPYIKKHANGIPIMATVHDNYHFDAISKHIKDIDCIGLNFKEQKVLPKIITRLRQFLKKNGDKVEWIHGFSTPRDYDLLMNDGTPGIAINKFRIDSLSFHVGSGFGGTITRESVGKHRYYNPKDNGTPKWNSMSKWTDGQDLDLSEYCPCPLCNKNSMVDVLDNYTIESKFSRAHEAISYKNESQRLRNLIGDSKKPSSDYIESKEYIQDFFNNNTF
jgi:hypothetical protein